MVLILPLDGGVMIPLLLIALVLSATIWMLRLAVGPFGHIKFLYLHQAYLTWPIWLRYTLQSAAVAVMLLSIVTLMGLVQFQ
ncbi:hypothetical protein [Bacterioplanes sanyensis]|uniref:hypothetical protein n=1 Tax=Bacterioplanes sanyensis TaxID=1249553 RepID=UPI0012FE02F7|nr:hypothetical protein [Bacterioplanes sanyensis]